MHALVSVAALAVVALVLYSLTRVPLRTPYQRFWWTLALYVVAVGGFLVAAVWAVQDQ